MSLFRQASDSTIPYSELKPERFETEKYDSSAAPDDDYSKPDYSRVSPNTRANVGHANRKR